MRMSQIIGKKVVALKRVPNSNKLDDVYVILFDDEKTFIKLREQDKYDYHDCSASAREIELYCDPGEWKEINDWRDADMDCY